MFESVRNFKSTRVTRNEIPLVISIAQYSKRVNDSLTKAIGFSMSIPFIEKMFSINDVNECRRVDILFDKESCQGMLRSDQAGFKITTQDKGFRGYLRCVLPEFLNHLEIGDKFEPTILEAKPRCIVFEIPNQLLIPKKVEVPVQSVASNNRRVDRPFSLGLE